MTPSDPSSRPGKLSPATLVRRFVPFAGAPLGAPTIDVGLAPRRWLPGMRLPGLPAPEPGPTLGRIGDLEVRLARSGGEVRRAQAIRYHVFYEETGCCARRSPSATAASTRRASSTCSR